MGKTLLLIILIYLCTIFIYNTFIRITLTTFPSEIYNKILNDSSLASILTLLFVASIPVFRVLALISIIWCHIDERRG